MSFTIVNFSISEEEFVENWVEAAFNNGEKRRKKMEFIKVCDRNSFKIFHEFYFIQRIKNPAISNNCWYLKTLIFVRVW